MKIFFFTVFLTLISLSTATRRIINGTRVDIENVPYQAGIILKNLEVFNGGGSFLSETFVITAAHCTEYNRAENLIVTGGSIYYEKGKTSRFQVLEKFEHPKYETIANDYDFALLRLERVQNFPKIIKFIKLPAMNEPLVVGEKLFVAGWGRTIPSIVKFNEYLLGATVPVLDQQICFKNYADINEITDRMFCAGYEKGGIDACIGDSGGGIATIERKETVLVGIVSWGIGCAEENRPGVYAKVSYVVDWISHIMN